MKRKTSKSLPDLIIPFKKEGLDPEKVMEESASGLESFLSDNPKAFDCKRCHRNFKPAPHQWIFHKLCDECFKEFDLQKMKGRIPLLLQNIESAYFEDSDAWTKAFPYIKPNAN